MKKPVEGMPFVDFLDLCQSPRDCFAFLVSSGFSLASEKYPRTNSFKVGFSFKYIKEPASVQVQYYDILFTRRNRSIPYLFIDRLIFNNHSDLQRNMFPRHKLLNVVARTATDVEQNYQPILNGDEFVWQKLMEHFNAKEKPKSYFER